MLWAKLVRVTGFIDTNCLSTAVPVNYLYSVLIYSYVPTESKLEVISLTSSGRVCPQHIIIINKYIDSS